MRTQILSHNYFIYSHISHFKKYLPYGFGRTQMQLLRHWDEWTKVLSCCREWRCGRQTYKFLQEGMWRCRFRDPYHHHCWQSNPKTQITGISIVFSYVKFKLLNIGYVVMARYLIITYLEGQVFFATTIVSLGSVCIKVHWHWFGCHGLEESVFFHQSSLQFIHVVGSFCILFIHSIMTKKSEFGLKIECKQHSTWC